MKPTISLALILAGLGLAPPVAAAPLPVTLTLTGASAVLELSYGQELSATAAATFTGTQELLLDGDNPTGGTVVFTGGDINMAAVQAFLTLGPLGQPRLGFSDSHLTGLLTGADLPPHPLNPDGGDDGGVGGAIIPGGSSGDGFTFFGDEVSNASQEIGGEHALIFDQGILTYTGTGSIGLLFGTTTVDFSSEPMGVDLPPLAEFITLTHTLAGTSGVTSTYDILLSAPFDFDILANDVFAAFNLEGRLFGAIVATGSYIAVPEPSTIVLTAVAVAALVPVFRRRQRS